MKLKQRCYRTSKETYLKARGMINQELIDLRKYSFLTKNYLENELLLPPACLMLDWLIIATTEMLLELSTRSIIGGLVMGFCSSSGLMTFHVKQIHLPLTRVHSDLFLFRLGSRSQEA
jgi:hypothetical protein